MCLARAERSRRRRNMIALCCERDDWQEASCARSHGHGVRGAAPETVRLGGAHVEEVGLLPGAPRPAHVRVRGFLVVGVGLPRKRRWRRLPRRRGVHGRFVRRRWTVSEGLGQDAAAEAVGLEVEVRRGHWEHWRWDGRPLGSGARGSVDEWESPAVAISD